MVRFSAVFCLTTLLGGCADGAGTTEIRFARCAEDPAQVCEMTFANGKNYAVVQMHLTLPNGVRIDYEAAGVDGAKALATVAETRKAAIEAVKQILPGLLRGLVPP